MQLRDSGAPHASRRVETLFGHRQGRAQRSRQALAPNAQLELLPTPHTTPNSSPQHAQCSLMHARPCPSCSVCMRACMHSGRLTLA
eukprot:270897-Chlamydomonas_euryale.AAC.2